MKKIIKGETEEVNNKICETRAKVKLFKSELEKQLNKTTPSGYTQLQIIVNKFIRRMIEEDMSNMEFLKYFELLARTQGALKQTPTIENNQKTIFITKEDVAQAHKAIDALINVNPPIKEEDD